MNRITFAVLVMVIAAIFEQATLQQASAQLSQWQRDQIASAMKSSAEQLDANRIPEKEEAEQQLQVALYELQQHLERTTDESNRQAWLEYLAITDLLKALEDEAEDKDVIAASQKIRDRSVGVEPGLEVGSVMGVRDAVVRIQEAYLFGRKEDYVKLLNRQLNGLAEKWSDVDSVPSAEDTATLSLVLSFLKQMDQDVALFQEMSRHFSRPNIHFLFSESLVQTAVQRSINQSRPVRECILGTSISGTANLMGNVSANLLPNDGAVRIEVALTGQFSSKNVGINGPVRLRTTGAGQVHSSRTITVSENGIVADPVRTTASLSTQINAIEHPLRLVRRIARKKAAEQKPQADRIALGKLREQVGTQFSEETSQGLSQPLPNPTEQLRPWLLRLDLPAPTRNIGSTTDSVYAFATLRRDWQLAAPNTAPPAPGGYDAVVQIHESLIDNSIGHLLSGRTIGEKELGALLAQRGNASSDAAADDDEEEEKSFEIDFARNRPIVFEARDGKLRLGVRGTRFAQGKKTTEGRITALEITADYVPVTTADGVVILKREGEVSVNFLGSRGSKFSQAGMRNTIRKRFAAAFPEYLMDQPWTLPSTVKNETLRNRVYRPRYLQADQGWLTIGVN